MVVSNRAIRWERWRFELDWEIFDTYEREDRIVSEWIPCGWTPDENNYYVDELVFQTREEVCFREVWDISEFGREILIYEYNDYRLDEETTRTVYGTKPRS